jgi:hypothetical protein
VKLPEDWRWGSYNNFALDMATIGACPIQIDDVGLRLRSRAGEKPDGQDWSPRRHRGSPGRTPSIIPAAIIVSGNGYEREHAHQLVRKHERCRGSGVVSYT